MSRFKNISNKTLNKKLPYELWNIPAIWLYRGNVAGFEIFGIVILKSCRHLPKSKKKDFSILVLENPSKLVFKLFLN